MDYLINQIVQGGIAFAVLILVVMYLKAQIKDKEKKLDRKDKDIQRLNEAFRENEKEMLSLSYKMLGFMEKMEENKDNNHEKVIEKIHEFRMSIEEKLKNLKNV